MNWFACALLAAFFWGTAPVVARLGLIKAEPML
jgi:uncharacterized membrane protein